VVQNRSHKPFSDAELAELMKRADRPGLGPLDGHAGR